MDDAAGNKESQSVVEFSDKKKMNPAPILVWAGFVLSVLFLIYLLVAKSGISSTISDMEIEKSDITSQLTSPSYADTEKQVMAASEAIDTLSEVKDKEISKKALLDEIYAHITNDAKIVSIAIGSDGNIAIDGATGSYRSVADLMIALKSCERLSDLKLASVALSDEGGVSDKEKVTFSISGQIDFAKTVMTNSGDGTSDLSADDEFL
jgi:Tfp pilus assembly protein PilN